MEKSKQNSGKIIIAVVMAALLIAILCIGTLTFAKYVTNESSDALQGTVAKWGYVVTVTADGLFPANYTKGEGNYAVKATGDGVAVKAAGAAVAPGTTGSLTFTVVGTAEVAAKITIDVGGNQQDIVLAYTDATAEYHPIKWTLSKGGVNLVENKTLSELATAVAAINNLYVAAGTAVNDTYTLTWTWDFEGNNTADTDLANIQAGTGTVSSTVDRSKTKTALDFVLTIGIEQVQVIPD